jgi:hypothetical protein
VDFLFVASAITGLVNTKIRTPYFQGLLEVGYAPNEAPAIWRAIWSVRNARYRLDFTSAYVLEMQGMALAHKEADRLALFLFEVPQEYDFGALSPGVPKLFAQIEWKYNNTVISAYYIRY